MPISIPGRKSWFSSLLYPASLVWTGICILLYYSNTTVDILEFVVFNTDQLILASIYEDVYIHGNNFGTWHLTPAPYFFPDMLLYFPIRALSGDFIVAHFIYTALQTLLILFLFRVVIRKVLPGLPTETLVVSHLLAGLFILGSIFTNDYVIPQLLLSVAAHTGSILSALLLVWLILGIWATPSYLKTAGLLLLTGIAVASDKLIIPMIVAPLTISMIILLRTHQKKALIILLILIMATIGGMFLFSAIRNNLVEIPKQEAQMGDWERSLEIFFNQVKRRLQAPHSIILLVLTGISFILTIIHAIRKNIAPTFRLACITVIVSFLLVHIFPLYLGIFHNMDCFRYTLSAEIFMLLLFPVHLYLLMGKTSIYISLVVFFLYCGSKSYMTYSWSSFTQGTRAYFTFRHPDSLILDEYADVLKNGVGTYWRSRLVQMTSKKGCTVRAVDENAYPNMHEANSQWYINNPPVIFNFFYLQRPPEHIEITDSIPCSRNREYIYVTREFCFRHNAEAGYSTDSRCGE